MGYIYLILYIKKLQKTNRLAGWPVYPFPNQNTIWKLKGAGKFELMGWDLELSNPKQLILCWVSVKITTPKYNVVVGIAVDDLNLERSCH